MTLPACAQSAAAALAAAILCLPAAAAAESHCGASYTVSPGDTLASIAAQCGTSVEALAEANAQVTDPGRISVGWELAIPGGRASLGPEDEVRPAAPSAAAEEARAEGSYEVRPGDSFASIATALKVSLQALMRANEGTDPFALRPGQTLRLPEGSGSVQDGAASEAGGEGEAGEDDARENAERGTAGRAARSADGESRSPAPDATQPEPEPEPERVTLEGRVQDGADCAVLETPEGELYSLVSAEYGLLPGEYVEIEGETVEMSLCGEGRATLRVTSLSPRRAPEGG